jgi:hypothetical protein
MYDANMLQQVTFKWAIAANIITDSELILLHSNICKPELKMWVSS